MFLKRGVTVTVLAASLFALAANAQEAPSDKVEVALAGEVDGTQAIETTATAAADANTPDSLTRAAAVYATYQMDVSRARDVPFSSGADIDVTLDSLGSQNADALTRGWLAYSALVAAQTPAFEESLGKAVAYYGPERIARGLTNDVRYANSFIGADRAVASALNSIAADARRINEGANVVKEQAYSLQSVGWAKRRFTDPQGRAAQLKSAASIGRSVDGAMLDALSAPDLDSTLSAANGAERSIWDGVTISGRTLKVPTLGLDGLAAIPVRKVSFGREPVADRIATLAALRAIGQSDIRDPSVIARVMTEDSTTNCLELAQLNLYQCVGAVHNQFEAPFCIGKHALEDVGQCFGGVTQ